MDVHRRFGFRNGCRLRNVHVQVYRIREFVKAQEVLHFVCRLQYQHADMTLPVPLLIRHTEVAFGESRIEELFPPLLSRSA